MPPLKEKLCSLSEAAALIRDGTRVHFGGMSLHNHPMAFIYELIRKGVKNLTIVGHVSADDVDLLVGTGCVKRVEISYVGLEEFGLAPNFRRAVERGEIELAEYSEPVSFERFQCSARGQSFFPTHEMLGTDLPKYNPDIKEMISPYDGRLCHIVPAANPEWVVIHAPMGDRYGNILYFERRQLPINLDLVSSRASNNLIVTVEQVIDHEKVLGHPHLNLIPRFRTTAVVEVPYGAHPSSCMPLYDHDREHLKMYSQFARDPAEFRKYLDKYIYGVKSHTDYLKLVGVERLIKLRRVGGNL
jgi:glutaconate CoA-transferase subunit A